jgi:hypothetical protein
VPIFYAVAALNVCAALLAMFVIKPMRARKSLAEGNVGGGPDNPTAPATP